MFKNRLKRRNFLQQTGLWAAAAAAGSLPNLAYAAREKELNIYCWEGYNSDDVLDPVSVASSTPRSGPKASHRIRMRSIACAPARPRYGISSTSTTPGAREMMYPEGLIRPLPRERFEPMFEKMMPAFHPPYQWAMGQVGPGNCSA